MNSDTRHFLELLWSMTEKELRARYKNTIFGFLWLVVNPLLQMLIIGFIFTFLTKEPVEHYYYHLFIGLIIWNFFSTSLAKTTPSIVNERGLIKKAAFPRAVIPLSIILSNLINIIVALILFIIPVLFLQTLSLSSLPAFALASILLLFFTLGICLLTSALDVRFRDINFFVQALLILWFYATPIIYSLGQIPRHLLWLWRFNPLTSVLQLMQFAFLNAAMPGPAMLTANIGVTIFIVIVGITIFKKESKNFDDWL